MTYLSGTSVSSKHYMIIPAAVSRRVQDTRSSLRLPQELDNDAYYTVSVSAHHSHRFHHAEATNHPRFGIGWKNDRRLTDLDFIDDIALAADEDHVCQEMTTNLAEHSAKFGLHISQETTKVIKTNHRSDSQPIYIGQAELECVGHFRYLVSVISKDGDVEIEVNTRLAKAATVFKRLDTHGSPFLLGWVLNYNYTAVVVHNEDTCTLDKTRCSAIVERPRCRVRYSFRQK